MMACTTTVTVDGIMRHGLWHNVHAVLANRLPGQSLGAGMAAEHPSEPCAE